MGAHSLRRAVVLALIAVTTMALPASAAAPANDLWTGAVRLVLGRTVELDTTLATTDAVDRLANERCGAPYTKASVWYRYKPTVTRRLSVDVSASDYSAGVIVTRGRPTDGRLVACGPRQVAFRAVADVRYFIMAFSDTRTNGGHLVLTLDRLVPPTLEVTVPTRGTVDRNGVATVTLSVRCRHSAYFVLDARLAQSFGHTKVTASAYTEDGPACDGAWHDLPLRFDSDTGLFGPGKALLDVGAETCNDIACAQQDLQAVELSLRRTT